MVARGQGKGGMNRQSTEDFQDSETSLYDTVMMDTWACPNPQNVQHHQSGP